MNQPVTPKIPFGGDHNPEQWPREVWDQDYRLFDAAAVDTVTLGVFDWALIQPAPDVYDFTLLWTPSWSGPSPRAGRSAWRPQ